MANYNSKIMQNAISGLNAQQAMLGVTSNNIANVNTPNYCKRTMTLEARTASQLASGVAVGNGVSIGEITRQTNEFLQKIVRESSGELQAYHVEDTYLERIEALFAFEGEHTTIGTTLNAFFAAADDLAITPANIELRSNFIARGEDLAAAISNTYNSLAELQEEADQRIVTEVDTINALTDQIADLNGQIKRRESAGALAADERDQRDALIEKLSEKLSFTATELDDGSVNITLATGFALVAGNTSRALSVGIVPTGGTGTLPPALNGGQLNSIVYDYSNGDMTSVVDLTSTIKDGMGSLGGLLKMRGVCEADADKPFEGTGTLIELAGKIEAIAQDLLIAANKTYLGDDPSTVAWDPLARDLNNGTPSSFGLFSVPGVTDSGGDGPTINDLNALGLASWASVLQFAVTDAEDVAAGRVASAAGTIAVGNADNIRAIAAEASVSRDFYVNNVVAFSGTYSEAYDEMVSRVGNLKNTSRVNLAVAEANLTSAQSRRDEVSGVSLDEEFTNLIKYQRAYEASARLIKIADQLLQEVVNLV